MYDAAASILQQKLSQVEGVGQVIVGGSSLPAVRVELNPTALNKYGIGLDDVRTALGGANANRPKGAARRRDRSLGAQHHRPAAARPTQYRPLIVAYRNGAPVRLGGRRRRRTTRSRTCARAGSPTASRPSWSSSSASRAPTSSTPSTASARCCRSCRPSIPAARSTLSVVLDRTHDDPRLGRTTSSSRCCISIALVILVVFLFLRNLRATLIPERRRAALADRHLRRDVPAGLQPRQSVADGADDLDRLRGGRRDRGDREHHPLPGAGHAAAARRRCAGRARSASRCCR